MTASSGKRANWQNHPPQTFYLIPRAAPDLSVYYRTQDRGKDSVLTPLPPRLSVSRQNTTRLSSPLGAGWSSDWVDALSFTEEAFTTQKGKALPGVSVYLEPDLELFSLALLPPRQPPLGSLKALAGDWLGSVPMLAHTPLCLSSATHCPSLSQPSPNSSPAAGTGFHGNGLFGQLWDGRLSCSIQNDARSNTQSWAASSQARQETWLRHGTPASTPSSENAVTLGTPALLFNPSKLSRVGRSQMYQKPLPSIPACTTKLRSSCHKHRVKW